MPSITLIANPAAGKGSCAHAVPKARTQLDELGLDYTLIMTEGPMHAVELARLASLEGAEIVAAMGGDGTVNEVLNGLMLARAEGGKARLAVLEAGRGNDFGYGAGIPKSLEMDCKLLVEGEAHAIDILKVIVDDQAPRYVGNGIGIGFDAMVGFVAAKHKVLSGFPSYLAAAITTLYRYYTPPKVRLTVDGDVWEQHALMVSLMNGRRMGGGFMMAPTAEPDDGLIDACIVASDKRHKLLLLMADFLKGAQGGKPQVKMRQAKSITVEALEGSLPAHADGETLCTEGKKIVLNLEPLALEVMRLAQ